VKLEFTARALREARAHDRWWRENRHAAPELFMQELQRALDQVRAAPNLGSVFKAKRSGREYRRVLMPVTRYHVYYSQPAADRVLVHSVWSGVRAKGPAL
jgi:hypothetical protein